MSGDETMLSILLLGAPLMEHAGTPLVTDTRKATALISYLAVTGEVVSRDRLSGLLWPETGQTKARAALRRTLSALSEARSEGWLLVEREHIALDRNRISTDVEVFRSLLSQRGDHGHSPSEICPECEAPLSGAVALYRGDFMAGFSLKDSAVFDDWQFFEGENLRWQLAAALEGLSEIAAAKGDWETATTHTRRWLTLDRLNESAHRRLMKILAWSGRRSAALKQYDECESILADELGVSPLEETILLYRDIRTDNPPPPPKLENSREKAASGTPPVRDAFFGREAEREILRSAYKGDGRVIFVVGEAGIGKTRLAGEFLSRIESEGAATIAAHCYESERGLAYGAFVEALSHVAANPDIVARLSNLPGRHLAEAARLVPELSPDESPPPLDTPGARIRFFEGVAQTLSAATSGAGPGIVFVDDVHLADDSSLELLAYLSRRLDKIGAVRLLFTQRDPGEVRPPLRKFREEARRSGGMVEVPVGRFTPETVYEMARAAGGVSPELSRRLYRETEGVPLFVGEYLRAISSGDLPSDGAAWLPPGGVREIVLSRLDALGETTRQTLGAAAAVGRSFDFDTVREASGRSEDEVLEAIEELVSRGVISEVRDAREATYDFSHGLLREEVYERAGLARRCILHRRIAASLARRQDVAQARIAHHHRLAGEDGEAARCFALAGEEARRLYANAEAKSNFEAALELGHPDAPELLEKISDLDTLAGEYEAALSNYGAALSGSDDASRLSRIERKLGGVYQRLGEWEPAEKHYLRAMERLGEGGTDAAPSDRAMLHADLGLLAHSRNDDEGAASYTGESLRLAKETGEPLTLARTHSVAAAVARGAGDAGLAREHLEESLAFSGGVDDPAVRIAALNNLALVLGESGESEVAIPTAEEALALCVKLGDRHREAAIRNNLADLTHGAGREEESLEHLRKAVEIFAEIGGDVGGRGELRPGIWRLVEW